MMIFKVPPVLGALVVAVGVGVGVGDGVGVGVGEGVGVGVGEGVGVGVGEGVGVGVVDVLAQPIRIEIPTSITTRMIRNFFIY
jgi:hypothetical protein